ncbi:hypothetical protein AVEN_229784-1 [Araneus ventricosus]|uniref:Uncharacterized protein n=1 Tax=Araneus ventricosus TaxID=182803 RepID=A0A4Y2MWM1_ARAVE|nr:hypothetical protein AVEN_229784-1 [Araneus ventricosus]
MLVVPAAPESRYPRSTVTCNRTKGKVFRSERCNSDRLVCSVEEVLWRPIRSLEAGEMAPKGAKYQNYSFADNYLWKITKYVFSLRTYTWGKPEPMSACVL